MPTPPRQLVRPHVDALAGLPEIAGSAAPEEIERRADELILEWTKAYFSGVAFQTPSPAGQADVTKTFLHCDVFSGKASPSDPSPRPIIHTMILDRREDQGSQIHGGQKIITGEWTMNTFIKCAPQSPVDPTKSSSTKTSASNAAEQAARRASSQFAWLIQSAHAQDIAVKGIGDPRITSGPRPIQSGAWEVYQITWTAKIYYTLASP